MATAQTSPASRAEPIISHSGQEPTDKEEAGAKYENGRAETPAERETGSEVGRSQETEICKELEFRPGILGCRRLRPAARATGRINRGMA
jgi:hypothetical protein